MRFLIALASPLVSILAHRAGPETLPASRLLLSLVIAAHLAIYYLSMFAIYDGGSRRIVLPVLDTAVSAVLFALVLYGFRVGARLVQTLTAVFGTELLLNLVLYPVLVASRGVGGSAGAPLLLIVLGVLLWSLSVRGHILRRATGMSYYLGVTVALLFFLFFYMLDLTLFGQES